MSGELTTPVYRSADLVAFASALFRRAGPDPDKAGTVAAVLGQKARRRAARTRGVSGAHQSAVRSS